MRLWQHEQFHIKVLPHHLRIFWKYISKSIAIHGITVQYFVFNFHPIYFASLQSLRLVPQTRVISLLQTTMVHQRHQKSNTRHPFLKAGLPVYNLDSLIFSTPNCCCRKLFSTQDDCCRKLSSTATTAASRSAIIGDCQTLCNYWEFLVRSCENVLSSGV